MTQTNMARTQGYTAILISSVEMNLTSYIWNKELVFYKAGKKQYRKWILQGGLSI